MPRLDPRLVGSSATCRNWQNGDDVIILPAISDEQATELFPEGWETKKPYLRVTRQPGA